MNPSQNAKRTRRAAQKLRWQRENFDKHRRATRRWRANNRERAVKAEKAWRAANPERYREKIRRFHEANPDYHVKRRAAKKLREAWLKFSTVCAANRIARAARESA